MTPEPPLGSYAPNGLGNNNNDQMPEMNPAPDYGFGAKPPRISAGIASSQLVGGYSSGISAPNQPAYAKLDGRH